MKQKSEEIPEPQDDPKYQELVESLAKDCHCIGIDKPCDGLLGGGLCDNFNLETQDD